MVVLMGGSGSTGSSLLKNILNRHTSIYAGEESNLFCKKELYEDFKNAKHRITKRGWNGLKNHGWHIYNGIDLAINNYPINDRQIIGFAKDSNTFTELISNLKDHFLQSNEQIWLEKTPANATSFEFFLQHFKEGRVIHITRNPLDTIASLVDRGYGLVYAIGIYLINTAAGLSHIGDPRCLTVKYEDLVTDQRYTIDSICDFLKIEFDKKMLESQNEHIKVSQLPGWQYDETANIGTKSVGRFFKLSKEKQSEILNGVANIRLNQNGKDLFNLKYVDIQSIATKLDYNLIELDRKEKKNFAFDLFKDRLNRLYKRYPTGIKYPLASL